VKTMQDMYEAARHAAVTWGYGRDPTTGGCVYRGPGGCRCAVGAQIDDAAYFPMLEQCGLENPTLQQALRASGVPDDADAAALLADMRFAHDWNAVGRYPIADYMRVLADIAERYGLVPHREDLG